ncbi:MAG: anti-sigma factor [Acidimicrobiales bacterium]
MTHEHCEHWRGAMAMEVVGQIGEHERYALAAHVEGCVHCRAERAAIAGLCGALGAADPSHVDQPEVPAAVEQAVLARLRVEARHDRRRRALRASAVLGAAAAVAALLVVQPWAGPNTTTVALVGQRGVTATATLSATAWGTEVQLRERGEPGGEVLTVTMQARSGQWWAAGTYRTATGRPVEVALSCAVAPSAIAVIDVTDGQGHVVLHGSTT